MQTGGRIAYDYRHLFPILDGMMKRRLGSDQEISYRHPSCGHVGVGRGMGIAAITFGKSKDVRWALAESSETCKGIAESSPMTRLKSLEITRGSRPNEIRVKRL